MCDCPEIQQYRKPSKQDMEDCKASTKWVEGDFYVAFTRNGPCFGVISEGEDNPPDMFKPLWLPRQDQLQAISGMTWVQFDGDCITKYSHFPTKEQAGIQVFMVEKHGKTWDGAKWL